MRKKMNQTQGFGLGCFDGKNVLPRINESLFKRQEWADARVFDGGHDARSEHPCGSRHVLEQADTIDSESHSDIG